MGLIARRQLAIAMEPQPPPERQDRQATVLVGEKGGQIECCRVTGTPADVPSVSCDCIHGIHAPLESTLPA